MKIENSETASAFIERITPKAFIKTLEFSMKMNVKYNIRDYSWQSMENIGGIMHIIEIVCKFLVQELLDPRRRFLEMCSSNIQMYITVSDRILIIFAYPI